MQTFLCFDSRKMTIAGSRTAWTVRDLVQLPVADLLRTLHIRKATSRLVSDRSSPHHSGSTATLGAVVTRMPRKSLSFFWTSARHFLTSARLLVRWRQILTVAWEGDVGIHESPNSGNIIKTTRENKKRHWRTPSRFGKANPESKKHVTFQPPSYRPRARGREKWKEKKEEERGRKTERQKHPKKIRTPLQIFGYATVYLPRKGSCETRSITKGRQNMSLHKELIWYSKYFSTL